MKLILFTLALSLAALAQDKPIPSEDLLIASSMYQRLQQIQKDIEAAIKKQEGRLCKEFALKADDCFVNWEKGIIGPKPAAAKPEPPKTEPNK